MKPLYQLLSVRLVGWSLAGTVAQGAFGGVSTIILARGLGPEALGGYGVFLAVAFLLNQIGSLGLGTAYVRLATPLFQAAQDVRPLTWTFFWARITAVGGLGAVALISGGLGQRLSGPGAVRPYLVGGVATALLLSVGSHYSEILRARFLHRAAAAIRAIAAAMRMVGYVGLFATGTLTLRRAIAVAVVVTIVESAMLADAAHRGIRLWPARSPLFRRDWLALSGWLFLTSTASTLLTQTDTLLLAALGGATQTGLWVAASRLVGVIPLIIGAVWSVSLPISMALDDPVKLRRYLNLSRRISVASFTLALAGTFLIAPLVSLFFGESYRAAVGAAHWLLVAFGANVAAVLYGGLVHRLGLERSYAAFSVLLLLLNGIGDIVLIPKFGATGCAAATTAVMVLGAIWSLWRVERVKGTLLAEQHA